MNPWLAFGLGMALVAVLGLAAWRHDVAERRRLDRLSEAEQIQEWLDQQW